MSVCCDYCVLSGRGLCDELIARPGDPIESGASLCVIWKLGELGDPGPLEPVASKTNSNVLGQKLIQINSVLRQMFITITSRQLSYLDTHYSKLSIST
jgi:hypothetical protein